MKQVSREFANDVITTAVEGGIGHWALISDYDIENPDTTANIRPDSESGIKGNWVLANRDMVQRGIDLIRGGAVEINQELRTTIINSADSDDAGDIDAGAADAIVQVAMFGEIVFG